VNDEKLKDPTDVNSAFNNFFTTITEKLNIQQIGKEDTVWILKDSSGNFPSIKIIPITEADIKSITYSLKQNKKKIIRLR
jgi:hypothetical protein